MNARMAVTPFSIPWDQFTQNVKLIGFLINFSGKKNKEFILVRLQGAVNDMTRTVDINQMLEAVMEMILSNVVQKKNEFVVRYGRNYVKIFTNHKI